MTDGLAGDFEFSSGHGIETGFDGEPKPTWAAPTLEELQPGTERYERAVAAFQEAADERDGSDTAGESDQG